MLAYTTEDDEGKMEHLAQDDSAAAVEVGRQKLESNEMDALDAALIYASQIPIDDKQVAAIIVEMRAYFSPDSQAVIAVPYTPKTKQPFRVHKPKVLAWEQCEHFDLGYAMESFFRGVADHVKGLEVWSRCSDEFKSRNYDKGPSG